MFDLTKTLAVEEFIRLCADGWRRGWHECSGGSLTYRMTAADIILCKPYLHNMGEWVTMDVRAPGLAGEFFITTGGGKSFRNVKADPPRNLGILEINDAGDAWRIVWGLEGGGRPARDFFVHFLCHSARKAATKGDNRVIYYCRAPHVVALTALLPTEDRPFTRALWQSDAECLAAFPEGVGVCPWTVLTGTEAAQALGEKLRRYRAAVWAQHGLFASGEELDGAFSLAHAVEKSAELCWLTLGRSGRRVIPDDGLRSIAGSLGITLNASFLDDE